MLKYHDVSVYDDVVRLQSCDPNMPPLIIDRNTFSVKPIGDAANLDGLHAPPEHRYQVVGLLGALRLFSGPCYSPHLLLATAAEHVATIAGCNTFHKIYRVTRTEVIQVHWRALLSTTRRISPQCAFLMLNLIRAVVTQCQELACGASNRTSVARHLQHSSSLLQPNVPVPLS